LLFPPLDILPTGGGAPFAVFAVTGLGSAVHAASQGLADISRTSFGHGLFSGNGNYS
jgi:hypothetical protein